MQNLVITNSGQELMSKLIAGTTTATFTKIAGSDYDYSDVSLEGITELEDVKQTALISKVSRTDLTLVEVLAALDNSLLTEGYYVKALGLYAKDGDGTEILYAISIEPSTPDYLPAFSGKTVSSITYRLITKVDNSEQVTLEVTPGAYPTVEQVEELSNSVSEISKSLQQVTEITTDLKPHAFNSLANNLTTTTTGYALDATQGKALNDKLGKVLWENTNPVGVDTMVITLSSDDFDVLDIYYLAMIGSGEIHCASLLKTYTTTIAHVYYSDASNSEIVLYRGIGFASSTKLELGILHGPSDKTENVRLIPLKIIGRKLS